ncbi:hypothetical protein EPUS_03634 [Endocarpon pusillum Z07020]|uniref:Zn(2)-C6 fungal-type domain-containing protein n=1 Tax=Endocarpon pusillum (strain Z07020 / HMAS-L-300199) TaxID=1263415 RepID=U1FXN4_ENDPU|nr:uncharacterized protein EPUS_03634 [Endocarpon pusillum Z07020]ERF69642.1 hypothetical protein EPUS_03634 [Endocarpon pusillum Z07020]
MATFDIITAESFAEESLQGEGRKRQRYREAVSCSECRQKKVKCDRSLPCNQCKIRKVQSKCTFTQTKSLRSPQSRASARNPEKRQSAAFQPHAQNPQKDFQEDFGRHENQLPGFSPRSTNYLAVPSGKDWTPETSMNELSDGYAGHQSAQQLQLQPQSSSWPMLTPPRIEHSQPIDTNGLDTAVNSRQFDLSMNSDIHFSRVPRQNEFFNGTNDTDTPSGQLPTTHFPHSFPISTMQQNTLDASIVPPTFSAAGTMHMPQPTTLITNQLLTNWVDDEGTTNALPWNFDFNWNS